MPSQAKLRAMSLRSETGRLVLQPPTELSLYHTWTANTSLERWEGKQEKGKKKNGLLAFINATGYKQNQGSFNWSFGGDCFKFEVPQGFSVASIQNIISDLFMLMF